MRMAPPPLLAVLIAVTRASVLHGTVMAPSPPTIACAGAAGAAAVSAAPAIATAAIMPDRLTNEPMGPPLKCPFGLDVHHPIAALPIIDLAAGASLKQGDIRWNW